MSKESKGFSDGRSGNDPNPPRPTNRLDDYLLATTRTEEKRAEDIKEYNNDYQIGTQQRLADELSKKNNSNS
jgi:hypothetical protein